MLLVSLLQLGAAFLALGVPDWGQLNTFLVTGVATWNGALALLQLFLWGLVIGLLSGSVLQVRRQAGAMLRRQLAWQLWSGAVFLVGSCILLAGLLHVFQFPLVMGEGSLQEASNELSR